MYFDFPYDEQHEEAKQYLNRAADSHNDKHPKRIPVTGEKYFKQLRRAYNAISGIGATTRPYRQSEVKDKYGDTILIYRDYGSDTDMLKAAYEWIEDNYAVGSDYNIGFYETLLYIARGGKIVWASNKHHRGAEALVFGKSSPEEKRWRKSYLSTPAKGALYPERLAHKIWESRDMVGDDLEITNGVLDAIRTIEKAKSARDLFVQLYIKDNSMEEQDVPF